MEKNTKNEIATLSGTEVSFQIPNTEALGKLREMKKAFSLTLSYKKQEDWKPNEEVRAFFMGLKEIPNEEGEAVKCGVFVTESECFIAGQKMLIDAVRELPTKTPVSITYLGKKANVTTKGSTNLFKIEILE